MAAWNELPAEGGSVECDALVDVADRLRWSAPELTVQFAMRALRSDADQAVRTRVHSLLAPSLVTLGRHAEAVEPALAALRAATAGGQIERSARLRVAIAACARALGEPLTGCEILRPVLQTKTAAPATRAIALGQFVTCAAHVGGRDDLEDALAEAERLLASDEGLSQDARRVEGALLAVRSASYHRRHGDTETAADTARTGLAVLNRLHDPISEGGRVRARLTLELVCALLDEGHLDEAIQAAESVLADPVRAAAAPAVGRLRLALATRVHIPAGRTDVGRTLLSDVVYTADRHGLDSLLADAWTFLAHADEQADHPTAALHALRSARAAEYRHMRAVDLARHRLSTEFGLEQRPERVVSQLRAIVRSGAPTTRPQPVSLPEQAARRLSAEDKRAARGSTFALALVSVAPVGTAPAVEPPEPPVPVGGDVALNALASHVRDLAPDKAELLRTDLGEFAVLLPHTTHAEAEHLATTIRDRAIESAWLVDDQGRDLAIRTGVATQPAAGDSPRDGVDALLDAARDALSRPFAPREESSNPDVADTGHPSTDTEHPDFKRPGSPRLGSARADFEHSAPPPGRPETEFPDFGLPDLGLPDFAMVDFALGEFGRRPLTDPAPQDDVRTADQVTSAGTLAAEQPPAPESPAPTQAPQTMASEAPAASEEPQGVSALLEAARSVMREQVSDPIAPDAPLPRRRRRAAEADETASSTTIPTSDQADTTAEGAAGRFADGSSGISTDTFAAQDRAAESRAADMRAADVPAAEGRGGEVLAAESRAADVRAADVRADEARAAEDRAAVSRAADVRSAEARAAEALAAEVRAAEARAAETRAAEVRAAETRAAETRAAEARAAETRAADARAAEARAAETRAADARAAEARAAETRAAEGWPTLPAEPAAPFAAAAGDPALARRDRAAMWPEDPATPVSDAQSLLSRFGIEPRGGGGRRRAPDEDPYASMFDYDSMTTPPVPEPENVPEPPEGPNIPTPPERPPFPPEPSPAPAPTPTPDEVPPPEPAPDVEPPPSTADMLARLSALVAHNPEPSRADAESTQLPQRRVVDGPAEADRSLADDRGARSRSRSSDPDDSTAAGFDGASGDDRAARRSRGEQAAEAGGSGTAGLDGAVGDDRATRRSRARAAEADGSAIAAIDSASVPEADDSLTARADGPLADDHATRRSRVRAAEADGSRTAGLDRSQEDDQARRSRRAQGETVGSPTPDADSPLGEDRAGRRSRARAAAEAESRTEAGHEASAAHGTDVDREPASPTAPGVSRRSRQQPADPLGDSTPTRHAQTPENPADRFPDAPVADTSLVDVESDESRAIAVSSEWLGFSALRGVGLTGGAQPGDSGQAGINPAESVIAPFPPTDASASVMAAAGDARGTSPDPHDPVRGTPTTSQTRRAAADHSTGSAVADRTKTPALTRDSLASPAAFPEAATPAGASTAPAGVAPSTPVPEPVTPTGSPNRTDSRDETRSDRDDTSSRYTEASRSGGVFDAHDSAGAETDPPTHRPSSAASAVVASSRAARRAAADNAVPPGDAYSEIAARADTAPEATTSTRAARRAAPESLEDAPAAIAPTGDPMGRAADLPRRQARGDAGESSGRRAEPSVGLARRASAEHTGPGADQVREDSAEPLARAAGDGSGPIAPTGESSGRSTRGSSATTTDSQRPTTSAEDPSHDAATDTPPTREQAPAAKAEEDAPVADVIPGAARSAAAAAWARRTAGKTDEERARRLSAIDGGASQAAVVRRTARRERTSSSGLAELLAEAMVAYQETTQPPPTPSGTWAADARAVDEVPSPPEEQASGGRRRAPEDAPPPGTGTTRSNFRGRHRSSEWAPADIDSG